MIKKLLKSKTFWTGIGTIIAGAVTIANGDKAAGIEMVAAGLAMIFIRDAIRKGGEK